MPSAFVLGVRWGQGGRGGAGVRLRGRGAFRFGSRVGARACAPRCGRGAFVTFFGVGVVSCSQKYGGGGVARKKKDDLPMQMIVAEDDLAALAAALTPIQRRFVEELEVDGVAYKAAIRAGYSEKSAMSRASKLLKMPAVQAYRQARMMVAFEGIGLHPQRLALSLLEVYNRCMEAVPVLEWDSEGREWVCLGKYRFDARGATRALELLGDSIGMFERKVTVQGEIEGMEAYLRRIGSGGEEL